MHRELKLKEAFCRDFKTLRPVLDNKLMQLTQQNIELRHELAQMKASQSMGSWEACNIQGLPAELELLSSNEIVGGPWEAHHTENSPAEQAMLEPHDHLHLACGRITAAIGMAVSDEEKEAIIEKQGFRGFRRQTRYREEQRRLALQARELAAAGRIAEHSLADLTAIHGPASRRVASSEAELEACHQCIQPQGAGDSGGPRDWRQAVTEQSDMNLDLEGLHSLTDKSPADVTSAEKVAAPPDLQLQATRADEIAHWIQSEDLQESTDESLKQLIFLSSAGDRSGATSAQQLQAENIAPIDDCEGLCLSAEEATAGGAAVGDRVAAIPMQQAQVVGTVPAAECRQFAPSLASCTVPIICC